MRILYVEDNPANLFLVQRVARMGNHEIVHYSEGQPALDHFKEDKPDLVLMDVQLPGLLTGLDVVKALRAAGHKTPIIAVTAYAMSGDREKCLEAGCDGYLSKPLPVGELVELFRRHDIAPTPAPVAAEANPEVAPTVPAATAQTIPAVVAVEKPETKPTEAEIAAPVQPVIEAPTATVKRDTSNDETIPSRPTLELKKAETTAPKTEIATPPAAIDAQPAVPADAPVEAEKPKAETAPLADEPGVTPPDAAVASAQAAATTEEKQPAEPPAMSNGVGEKVKVEGEK